jgi:hypothetical protein
MGTRVIPLELDDKPCRELEEVTAHLRLGAIEDALRIAAADWVSRRKAEIDTTTLISAISLFRRWTG